MPDTCPDLITKATGYLTRQTAAWPTERLQRAVRSSACHDAARRIDAAALAGDVQACVSACRSWWKTILSTPEETL